MLVKKSKPRSEIKATPTMNDISDIIKKADAARDAMQWSDAAILYQSAIDLQSDNPAIWVQLGNMNKEAGNHAAALEAYQFAQACAPTESDIHLQMGHLFKIMQRSDDATESYRKALQLDPENRDAFDELAAVGLRKLAEKLARPAGAKNSLAHKFIFDVTDLVCYIGHHPHLTGIQRVQSSIILSIAHNKLIEQNNIQFISYNRISDKFFSIKKDKFIDILEGLTQQEELRTNFFDKTKARHGELLPESEISHVILKGNSTLVLLGAAWVIPSYASMVVNLKRQFGCRFAMVFHDLIPVYARETCDQPTVEVFTSFFKQIIGLVDEALCVSQNTANDLLRYCAEMDFVAPKVTVTRLGSGFADTSSEVAFDEDADISEFQIAGPFVLFVSTIEGRKNHDLALRIWRNMLAEGVEVPRLVCVGRLGWRSENFFQALIATNNLDGKIQIMEDISDTQLKWLYDNCTFTIYPSLYEGWGLPVSESLEHGKVCVTSRVASLPEVAGDLGVYIPIDNAVEATAIVRHLIEDKAGREALEARIKAEYKPDSWHDVAGRIIDACMLRQSVVPRAIYPELEPGAEYALRNPSIDTNGVYGEQMRDMMVAASRGILLGELVSPKRINDALLMRSSDWNEPESFGSWTKSFTAQLQFALAPDVVKPGEKLMVYIAVRNPGGRDFGTMHLRLGKNMATPVVRDFNHQNQTIAAAFPSDVVHSGPVLQNGLIQLTLEITFRPKSGATTPPPLPKDARSIGFGVLSFLCVPENNITVRQAIVEQVVFGT